eukprot:CAMPEP_0198111604 /NCGR_PEP_ID=MMETSP1442-20131203/3555_1 /TAXON_ID= /ORGANISM="Craspedostauros australis, Strain CCMP3328" /LENGTH=124 /DNA_ID=CAMNT_0043768113 /DNA_START=72 /DNA_END=446 /DNA_ORIENTATION=+
MKTVFAILLTALLATAHHVAAFAPMMPATQLPPVEIAASAITQQQHQQQPASIAMQQGIQNYVTMGSVLDSSTLSLSLKERPPPPTKEELEAKKRNFNFWFWGGGFVAPFIATIYYFGPKFWKY